MADGHLENRLLRSVMNRKLYTNLFDGDVPHDITAVYRKQFLISFLPIIRHGPLIGKFKQSPVILFSLRQKPCIFLRVHLTYCFDITRHRPGLMKGIPPIRECRIGDKSCPDQHHCYQQQCYAVFLYPISHIHYLCCCSSASQNVQTKSLGILANGGALHPTCSCQSPLRGLR